MGDGTAKWGPRVLVCVGLWMLGLGCTDDTTVVETGTGSESESGTTATETGVGIEAETGDETETSDETETGDEAETETSDTGCSDEGCACETNEDCAPGLECAEGICAAILPSECGNAIVEPGEACDDGNTDETDGCTNACSQAVCGDGIVWDEVESCDDGNLVEGDGCNSDCVVSASVLEVTIIDGGEGNDQAYAVAFDIEGNFIIAGRLFQTGQSCDLWIGKFEPDGSELWSDTVNGAANGCDYARAVAVDDNENIVVAGTLDEGGPGGGRNIWVRRYSPDGEALWTTTHDEGGGADFAFGVDVDAGGNAYVAGWVAQGDQGDNAWVTKLAVEDGSPVWTQTYDGPGSGTDYARAIAVTPAGEYVITGRQFVGLLGDGTNDFDLFVRKYDADNQLVWADSFGGSDDVESNLDEGWGVAIDEQGAVAVTGFTDTLGEAYDVWLRKYASEGGVEWTATYANEIDHLSEYGREVAFGPDGSLVVGGTQWAVGDPNHRNVWLGKWSGAGELLWTRADDSGDLMDDEGWGVAVEDTGEILFVGYATLVGDQQIFARRHAP